MRRVFKIIKKTVLGLAISFAAFVGLDFGIRVATSKGAPLTEDQIDKAKAVFGNSIDYSKVRIAFDRISYFQPDGLTVTLGNTIHYPPKEPTPEQPADDKAPPKESKPTTPIFTIGYTPKTASGGSDLFIHEMTHVWQHQNSIKGTGVTGAVGLWLKNLFNKEAEDVYSYTLDEKKSLSDYNLEQQARIVENYFVMRKDLEQHPDKTAPAEWALLKKTVESAIPPATPAAGQNPAP